MQPNCRQKIACVLEYDMVNETEDQIQIRILKVKVHDLEIDKKELIEKLVKKEEIINDKTAALQEIERIAGSN